MLPTEVVQDTKYKSMFKLRYDDGVLDTRIYNYTRANDILNNYDYYIRNINMTGNQRASKHLGRALYCTP